MAHFFHDTLPPYQFIDPSLLVDSSPNGVYLPLLGGSTGSAKIGNDYHSFGLEDLEDPKDGLHTPFRSDYGSFLPGMSMAAVPSSSSGLPSLSDTTITPSTQLQQVSSNGFHGSTTKTEPQFENFLELSSALLSSFNAEHEPDYVTGISSTPRSNIASKVKY
jgi:hypothetical protein